MAGPALRLDPCRAFGILVPLIGLQKAVTVPTWIALLKLRLLILEVEEVESQ